MPNQFDRTVSSYLSFLDNEYVSATLSLLLILYASVIAPKLPEGVLKYFNNPFVQILLFFIIIFVANNNATLALLIAIAVLVTLMVVNNQIIMKGMMTENFDDKTFRQHPNTYYNAINPYVCDSSKKPSNFKDDHSGKDECRTCDRSGDEQNCNRCDRKTSDLNLMTSKSMSNVKAVDEDMMEGNIETYSNVSTDSMMDCLSCPKDTSNLDNLIVPKIEVNRNVQSNNLGHLSKVVYPSEQLNSSCGVDRNFPSSDLRNDGMLYTDHKITRA